MKNFSKCSLFAATFLISLGRAFAESDAQNTPIVVSANVQSEGLYEALVKEELSLRHRKMAEEIETLEAASKLQNQSARSGLDSDIARHNAGARDILNSIIESDAAPEAAAEARFKLAILESKSAPEKASKLISGALKILGDRPTENIALGTQLNLFAGDLAFLREDFSKSHKFYLKAVKLASQAWGAPNELILRAHLGAGDTAFQEYRFEEADASYLPALNLIKNANPALRETFEPFHGPILVRRLWATFRGGHYAQAAEIAQDFARQQAVLPKNTAPEVMSDIVRSAGIALSEKGDIILIRDIASDPRAGDLGKDIALATMQNYLRIGRVRDAEKVALAVDSHFLHSNRLVEFMESRWTIAKRLEEPQKIQSVGIALSERLAFDSSWRKESLSDASREKHRAELVARVSLEVAETLLQTGFHSQSKLPFLKAHTLLRIHLDESEVSAPRSTLNLKAGRAALLAHDLPAAWKNTQASLSFPMGASEKKAAYHQLVEIALQQSANASSPASSEIKNYLTVVDAYVRAFPEEASARLALFESARKLETLGDINTARERLERLVAQSPAWTPFENNERENIVLALLALNAKDANTHRATNALNDLERQFENDGLSSEVKTKIQASNAAAIREHAASLRSQGKLTDALNAQLAWANENAHNPETPLLLADTARDYFELGMYKQSGETASLFIANYPKHTKRANALYWKARSLEAELAFLPAANAFVAASWESHSSLSHEERIDALARCQQILAQLGDRSGSARILERLAAAKTPFGGTAQDTLLQAGLDWLAAKQFVEAERVFNSLSHNKSTSAKNRSLARLGSLEARIKGGRETSAARHELSQVMASLSHNKNSDPKQIDQAALLALESDFRQVAETEIHPHSIAINDNLSTLKRVERDAKSILEKYQQKLSPVGHQKAALLVASIQGKLAEKCTLIAEGKLSTSSSGADLLLQQAEQYRLNAKQTLFESINRDKKQRAETAQALASLGTIIRSDSEPALEILEPQNDMALETLKEVFLVKKDEEPKP
jgi:hypothetical protein